MRVLPPPHSSIRRSIGTIRIFSANMNYASLSLIAFPFQCQPTAILRRTVSVSADSNFDAIFSHFSGMYAYKRITRLATHGASQRHRSLAATCCEQITCSQTATDLNRSILAPFCNQRTVTSTINYDDVAFMTRHFRIHIHVVTYMYMYVYCTTMRRDTLQG